jgi:hypothetical protein
LRRETRLLLHIALLLHTVKKFTVGHRDLPRLARRNPLHNVQALDRDNCEAFVLARVLCPHFNLQVARPAPVQGDALLAVEAGIVLPAQHPHRGAWAEPECRLHPLLPPVQLGGGLILLLLLLLPPLLLLLLLLELR